MAENTKTPAIRFKGFTEAWVQRKLGDIGSVAMNRRIFKHQTTDTGDVPFYKIGTFGGEPDAFISRELFEEYRAKYPYPECGDILISASGSIGRTVEYGGEDEYFQDSNIVWLKHDKSIINSFLKHLYSVVEWAGIEGSTIKRLYNDNILKTDVMFPSISEQEKIAEALDGVDNLITLHQRKYDKLKSVKNSMLEKMFPKDGAHVPEIRFKGFTEAWEQRRLGKIAAVKDSARIPNALWTKSGIPYIRASDLSNDDLSGVLFLSEETYEFYKNQTGAPEKNDVLFNGGGEIGKTVIKTDNTPLYVQGGAVLYVKTAKSEILSGQYLKTYFETDGAKAYMKMASAGGTIKHFTLKPAQEMAIKYPNKQEQEQIGVYFCNLDALLTLHQRKLENLKNLKKACLEKMFV